MFLGDINRLYICVCAADMEYHVPQLAHVYLPDGGLSHMDHAKEAPGVPQVFATHSHLCRNIALYSVHLRIQPEGVAVNNIRGLAVKGDRPCQI